MSFKTYSVLLTLALTLPFFAQAAQNPSEDPNNLTNLNACKNFSKENPEIKVFKYFLNGEEGEISATLYPGLNKCLDKLKQKTGCPKCSHVEQEDQDDKNVIDNIVQSKYLKELSTKIQEITPDKNDQARIAISMVQNLPFEKNDKSTYDYPYEVAFNQTGICNETAKLIILLLRDLGFETAMLTFEKDNHQAAGIKCDLNYSYQNSGFCFAEATTRAIITDPIGLKSDARIHQISQGLTFDASKDYMDSQDFIYLLGNKEKLDSAQLTRLAELKKSYGITRNSATRPQ